MPASTSTAQPASHARPKFAFDTTRWSLILQTGANHQTRAALEKLCQLYWPPIYAHIRRRGHMQAEAEDLTQEFFASLLSRNSLATVHPQKGRFRSFLLAALRNFLNNEWHRSKAQKRGGRHTLVSLDAIPGIEAAISRDETSADAAFDRRWAETVLARVNRKLRKEYENADQGERFETLKIYLLAGSDAELVPYAQSAKRLGLTIAAVKSAIFKLRRRYADALRAEIAQTVSEPEEIDDEIRYLLRALT